MRTRFYNNKISAYLALIICVIASFYFWQVDAERRIQKSATLQIKKSLIEESQNFSIYNKEHCVGKLRTRSEASEDSLTWYFNGSLQVQINNTNSDIKLNGFSQLNSLQQIIGLQANLMGPENGFSLKIAGLKEIVAVLSSGNPQKTVWTTNFIGPITLENLNNTYYGLLIDGQAIKLPNDSKQPIELGHELEVKNTDCELSKDYYLNLDKYLNLVKGLI